MDVGFLKSIGKGLATVAEYAAKGALYVSRHPEVIRAVGAVATLAGVPAAAAVVAEAGAVAQAVGAVAPVAAGVAARISQ